MTGRERVFATLTGQPRDHLAFLPITMMLAAERIGVPYRTYATDYNALVAGQLRVAEDFGADVVSCISDPAREAADCGAALHLPEDLPPGMAAETPLIAYKGDLAHLTAPKPEDGARMHDRLQAARALRECVGEDLVVEGWVEGPCAEGANLRGLQTLMMDFYEDPDFVRDLFEFTLALGIEFARAQFAAGAHWIGIGDAAASLVGPVLYHEFVLPYEKRLVDTLHAGGIPVRLHICGNITPLLAGIGSLGCELVDIDWMVPMAEARAKMGEAQVLAGNLNPVNAVQRSDPKQIAAALAACYAAAGQRYIAGAGCEIPRGTPDENLAAMRDYAQSVA
ncbi:MAG: uroporphyrinogen decarboxylase family protein [Candidatus Hydrogenedentota bacterium]